MERVGNEIQGPRSAEAPEGELVYPLIPVPEPLGFPKLLMPILMSILQLCHGTLNNHDDGYDCNTNTAVYTTSIPGLKHPPHS